MSAYIIPVLFFLGLIMLLVTILFFIEKKVIGGGDCKVLINGDEEKSPTVSSGTNLLSALSSSKI